VRQLRGPREVQYATLCAIIPIAQDRPDVFRPYLASFFVREPTDAAFVMMLKLDLLSLLVTADTVAVVLTELETYVDNANKSFVGGAVRCVGRIAGAIPAATEQCLSGLMTLITCPHDHVVAEAVVVTRTLLQQRHSQYPHVVRQVVDKLARIVEPSARASIVWIAAEHVDAIMPRAPDILRSLATSFADEDTLVKAQIVNFAIKLAVRFDRLGASDELHQWGAISRSQFARVAPQVVLLLRYVLEQARFDSDYDVRDRARSVYVLLSPVWASGDNDDAASAAAASGASAAFERASLFLCPKPTPVVQSVDSAVATDVYGRFSVSSLSHVVGHMAFNYQALPPWPRPGIDVVPSNSVRDASASAAAASNASSNTRVNSGKSRDRTVATSDLLGVKPLAATTSASRRRSSSAGGSSYDSHSSSSGSDGVSSGSSSSDDSDDSYTSDSGSSRSRSSSSSSSDTDADEASGDRGVATTTTTAAHVHQALSTTSQGQVQQSQHQHQQALNVLDLYSSTGTAAAAATPMHGTSQGDVVDVGQSTVDLAALDLSSSLSSSPSASPAATAATAVANEKVLLSHVHSSGLQVNYWFTRETSIYSLAMTVVKLRLTNTRASALRSVRVDKMRLLPHQQMVPFPTLDVLEGHATAFAQVHIDFAGEARQACKFDLASDRGGAVTVSLSVPAGELMTRAGVPVDRASFELARAALSGMHETKCSFERTPPIGADVSLDSWVERQVLRIGNFARVSMPTPPAGGDAVGESPVVCGYAARSSQDQLVLVTVELEERCGAEGSAANKTVLVRLAMNSGDVMLGTRLLDEMKTLLKETP
jgi:AP-3 complex subunit beta